MKTYMPKVADLERKWYVIDAAGKPLGRVATVAAVLLRGKHKTTFAPHVDCGDHVIIINCAEATLSGNKTIQKYYHRFTGYIGNMKSIPYDILINQKPEKVMELAVKGMIPRNVLGRKLLTKLRLYAGAEHEQAAQKPEAWKI